MSLESKLGIFSYQAFREAKQAGCGMAYARMYKYRQLNKSIVASAVKAKEQCKIEASLKDLGIKLQAVD